MSVSLQDLESMMYELTDIGILLEKYFDEVRRLQKRDGHIIVSGLDDTLFSRTRMLQSEPLLKEDYSAEEIDKLAMYHIGVPHLLETYYVGKITPNEIVGLMSPERDFILSHGFENIQRQKISALGLSNFPMRVVPHKEEKVLHLIQHILYEIKYLPEEIIIYENTPDDFIKYKPLIESILTCKLKIMYVEMNEENQYIKIEEIK